MLSLKSFGCLLVADVHVHGRIRLWTQTPQLISYSWSRDADGGRLHLSSVKSQIGSSHAKYTWRASNYCSSVPRWNSFSNQKCHQTPMKNNSQTHKLFQIPGRSSTKQVIREDLCRSSHDSVRWPGCDSLSGHFRTILAERYCSDDPLGEFFPFYSAIPEAADLEIRQIPNGHKCEARQPNIHISDTFA
jgi:hypothetical protein